MPLFNARFVFFAVALATRVYADNPYDWSPSVSVTDNLDEPDGAGFCIDIRGFGASLDCSGDLQAHSCKEAGTDTQFEYHEKSLRAVNYNVNCQASTSPEDRLCVTVVGDIVDGATLSLAECDDEAAAQTFELVNDELRIGSGLCLVVDQTLRAAGRFWARNLFLGSCDATAGALKTWTITPEPASEEEFSLCFPANARVHHELKGWIPMTELSLGDSVLVDHEGKHEPVYSFGHYASTTAATYVQMMTDGNQRIELSSKHMIFVRRNNVMTPVAAETVVVGDVLQTSKGDHVTVSRIKSVLRAGAYAPFTPSGTIVVDDVVASNFVIMTTSRLLPHQWIAHAFEFPHRTAARHYFGKYPFESYNEYGISTWVARPHQFFAWLFAQKNVASECVAFALMFLSVPILLLFSGVEILSTHGGVVVLVVLVGGGFWRYRNSHGNKKTAC